jgi:hypothetical protein
MVIAVPPITNDHLLYVNLMNPYHLNLWSPRQWKFAIESCFAQCTPILHGVRTIGGEPRSDDLEPGSSLDETTFAFAETMIDEMYRVPTLTAIFLAAGPRDEASAPADDDPTVFVDESFSRSSGEIPPYWKKRLEKFEPSRRDRIRLRLRSARRVFDRDGVSGLIRRSADAAGRWWRARS